MRLYSKAGPANPGLLSPSHCTTALYPCAMSCQKGEHARKLTEKIHNLTFPFPTLPKTKQNTKHPRRSPPTAHPPTMHLQRLSTAPAPAAAAPPAPLAAASPACFRLYDLEPSGTFATDLAAAGFPEFPHGNHRVAVV